MSEAALRPQPPPLAEVMSKLPEQYMQQAVRSLKRARPSISSAEDIMLVPKNEVQRITILAPTQVSAFLAQIASYIIPAPIRLIERVSCDLYGSRLSWGDPILDHHFRGGLYPKGITEIAGESSAGKSQLCMQLLLQAQLPVHMGGLDGACVYLCTEGNVPLNRFKKFAEYYRKEKYTTVVKDEESGKSTTSSLLKDFDFHENVFIEKVDTMDAMWGILSSRIGLLINKKRPVKLIIIDSIAALFRFEFGKEDAIERSKVLWNYANQLKFISETYNICIVVVNQVTAFFEKEDHKRIHRVPVHENQTLQLGRQASISGSGGKVVPSLGLAWSNCINTRVVVTRTTRKFRPNKRKLDDEENAQTDNSDRDIEEDESSNVAVFARYHLYFHSRFYWCKRS